MKENWDELIKQQERSGMKPTAFCRVRGIDPSKFGYQRWRRKGARTKDSFVRVDSGVVTLVEIVVKDGITIRVPLSAIRDVLEALDASRS